MTLLSGILSILTAIWAVLREASPYLLVGLALAGVLNEFVDTHRILGMMGGRTWKSILVATILGAPLPLCSCGVLPAAVSLRRKGASRGATLAFVVSTPETGVDSLFLTWGLLGPLFALIRAIVGMIMGVLVGGATMWQGHDASGEPSASLPATEPDEHADSTGPLGKRLRQAARHGFVELFGDLAFWLLLGFVASGIVMALLPEGFFASFLPNEWLSFLAMAVLGAFTYVCASASTPLAAAMIAGGLNPGAAIVFLLTGPATNPATLLIVGRHFGRRTVAIYLSTVFAASFGAGLVLNRVLPTTATMTPPPASSGWRTLIEVSSAIVLLVLTVFVLRRRGIRGDLRDLAGQARDVTRALRAVRWGRLAGRVGLVGAALALAFWLSSAFFRVRPGERAVVRLLGRVRSADVGPGLHVAAPAPFGRVELVAADAIRTTEIGFRAPPFSTQSGPVSASVFPAASPSFSREIPRLPFESQFVTGDENVIEATAVVQYRVRDVALYRLGSERADGTVWALARSILVREMGRLPVDAVYSTARGQIEMESLQELRRALAAARTGLEPLGLRLLYVHAPDDVHQAFRDVASAAEDSATSRNLALVESEGSIREARAQSGRLVLEADGTRFGMVDRARGAAAAFVGIRREYERAPGPTRLRLYLETAERVLAPVRKWIKPAGARGLELWLSGGETVATVPGSLVPQPPSETGGAGVPPSSAPMLPVIPALPPPQPQ